MWTWILLVTLAALLMLVRVGKSSLQPESDVREPSHHSATEWTDTLAPASRGCGGQTEARQITYRHATTHGVTHPDGPTATGH